ncbi:MAG: SAM-dependent methyltransferase [Mycobacterium sp.]
MPESSIVVRPEPPEAHAYTASSRLQAAGLAKAIKLFESAANEVPLPRQPAPIVIADYGASTGHNSLLPIGAALKVLRTRTRPEHPVLVAHTDVPDNDFTALFRTLADDADSYLHRDRAIYCSAVGRSFYSQVLPSNSVTLGWTSWAVQWLSRTPAEIPEHIHVCRADDETVHAAFLRQAAEDWHEFVAFRGRELAPGGRLVVLTMGLTDAGDFGMQPLFDATVTALQICAEDELVSLDEVAAMSIPITGRRERDFLMPFAPSGRFEGVSIEHLEEFDAGDRFWRQYEIDGNAAAFGKRWAGFARAVTFDVLASALGGDSAQARATPFKDRLETELASHLAANPAPMQIPLAALVLAKRTSSR